MADVYDYIDTTGVIMTNAGAIQTEVQSEYQNTFGMDLNVDPSTPQGMLITVETAARVAVADNNANLANQINPNVAGGVFLDALMALTGVQRTPASPSTVLCNISGIAGTSIPAGAQISTSDGQTVFEIVSTTVIPTGGFLAGVQFQSVQTGPISASSGTLTSIVSSILGWETVINPLAATLGVTTQSDVSARLFRQNTLGAQGNSLVPNVIAALYQLPGVQQNGITFLENIASTTTIINGISMVGHSIYTCVGGTATYEQIAAALTNSKSAGAAYNNGLGIPISQLIVNQYSGQSIDVLFDTPMIINISIEVTVHQFTTVQNVTQVVQDAILAYAAGQVPGQPGFAVGQAVSPFQIAAAISYAVPGLFVQEIQVGIQSFVQQGTITNSSTAVTGLTYNAPVTVGGNTYTGIATSMTVTDSFSPSNIPNSTTVSALVGSTGITLSNAASFQSFVLNGTLTNGSITVTNINSTAQIAIGDVVTGTGLSGSPTVASIVDINTITLSAAATQSITTALTFTPGGSSALTTLLTFGVPSISYQTTEIPIGVWQQAVTSAPLITVTAV